MQQHLFPGTDLSVSKLCFGCWGITGDMHWGERVESESAAAILAAIDSEVNFFDTAPMYADGESEELLGRVLAESGRRDEVVIATKIRPDQMAPDDVVAECEGSLRRLQTDYIDLYQTHWTAPDVPIAETWGVMQELQKSGKVRHIGVCNAGIGDMSDIVASQKPHSQKPLSNQLPYNLLSRMIEFEILPRCIEQQIGVLVYSPLMHGILADKYQDASEVPDGRARSRHFSSQRPHTRHGEPGCESETFAALDRIREIAKRLDRSMSDVSLSWTIQQPGVVSVIAGAKNAEQLIQNVNFLRDPIPSDVVDELNTVTDELKTALGSNPDLWDAGPNARYR